MTKKIQTAVMGVSGYAGAELARLLLHHPQLRGVPPVFLGRAETAQPLTELHPQLMDNNGSHALKVEPFSWDLLKERGVDVLFLATPHEQSREWAPQALEHGIRIKAVETRFDSFDVNTAADLEQVRRLLASDQPTIWVQGQGGVGSLDAQTLLIYLQTVLSHESKSGK